MDRNQFLVEGDLTYLQGKAKELRVQELVHRVFQHFNWSTKVKWWNPLTWFRFIVLDRSRLSRATKAANEYAQKYLCKHASRSRDTYGIKRVFQDLAPNDPKLGEFVFSILPPEIDGFSLSPSDGEMQYYAVRYKKPQRAYVEAIGPEGWNDIIGTELHVEKLIKGTVDRKKKILTFEGLRGEKLLRILGMTKLINLKLKKIRFVERSDGTYNFVVTVASGLSISEKWSKEKFVDTFKHLSWDKT